jgi:hypothetical protein
MKRNVFKLPFCYELKVLLKLDRNRSICQQTFNYSKSCSVVLSTIDLLSKQQKHSSAAHNNCKNAKYLRNVFAGFTINEKGIHFINIEKMPAFFH